MTRYYVIIITIHGGTIVHPLTYTLHSRFPEQLTYTCDTGYVGNYSNGAANTLNCMTSGQWDIALYTCNGQCDVTCVYVYRMYTCYMYTHIPVHSEK